VFGRIADASETGAADERALQASSSFLERPGGKPRLVTIARRAPSSGTSPVDDREHPRRAETTIVEPRGGGAAGWAADRLRGHRPIWAFTAVALAGYALLAAAIVLLGLLLTQLLLPIDSIADADRWLPDWLADHRSPRLDDASFVGSMIGDAPVLPALLLATLIGAAVVRRLRIGVFLVTAAVMELALYRVGALAAPRERPDVPRLDDLPVDESFPSGHVAASVVVYIGLALIISSAFRRRWVTALVWTVAIAMVLVVSLSRMYRGMHHPFDTLGGLLLGLGCLLVALVAVRAFGAAQRLHHSRATRAVPQE
jgi:membrane-associated phospholipid phosphatase